MLHSFTSAHMHNLCFMDNFVYGHDINYKQEPDPLHPKFCFASLIPVYYYFCLCNYFLPIWSQGNCSVPRYCIWSGDLQTCCHKSRNANHRPRGLLWCLEVWAQFFRSGIQKNNHGLGNENWNHSGAGSFLKCFRMHPEAQGLWFHHSPWVGIAPVIIHPDPLRFAILSLFPSNWFSGAATTTVKHY